MLKILPVLTIIADLNLLPPEKTLYFIGLIKCEYLLFFLKIFSKKVFISYAITLSLFEKFCMYCVDIVFDYQNYERILVLKKRNLSNND